MKALALDGECPSGVVAREAGGDGVVLVQRRVERVGPGRERTTERVAQGQRVGVDIATIAATGIPKWKRAVVGHEPDSVERHGTHGGGADGRAAQFAPTMKPFFDTMRIVVLPVGSAI